LPEGWAANACTLSPAENGALGIAVKAPVAPLIDDP